MSNDQIDNVARPHSPSTQVLEMTLKAELRLRRRDIIKIAQYYGAHNIRIFGSVKNEIERLDSDIDFLVDLEKGRSLLEPTSPFPTRLLKKVCSLQFAETAFNCKLHTTNCS